MKAQDFFKIAQQSLSNDPKSRADKSLIQAINENRNSEKGIHIDVHAHCFTYDNVPWGFPGGLLHPSRPIVKPIARFLFKLARRALSNNRFEKYLDRYGKHRFLRNQLEFRSMDEVFIRLVRLYNMVHRDVLKREKFEEPHLIIVELMMAFHHSIKGGSKAAYYRQWKEMAELMCISKNAAAILPYWSGHPDDEGFYSDFLAAFSPPNARFNQTGQKFLDIATCFFGLKLYPPLGYEPSHPKLMEVYKVCIEKNIPILSHCGGGSTRFNKTRSIELEFLRIQNEQTHRKREKVAYPFLSFGKRRKQLITERLCSPDLWLPVLHEYPDLRLCIAHLGDTSEWEKFLKGDPKSHVQKSLDIIGNSKFPNVYGDLSYSCTNKMHLRKINEAVKANPHLAKKLMFGSDYYLSDLERSVYTVVEYVYKEIEEPFRQNFIHDNARNYLGL